MTGATKPENTSQSDPPGIVGVDRQVRQRCSHCGREIVGRPARHFGTHVAHQEDECLRILHAEIERLHEALRRNRTWGAVSPEWSYTIAQGVRDWVDGGMTGDLPALPDWAGPNV